ncbi:MAG TPA: hypothetical protein VH540_07930 [Ktedonobacterales bacterium]|jgi:hypothetical protein
MQPDFSKVTSDIFTLASLTDNLPIVTTPEGEYVPLRALCEIVGLRPSTYIGVFCAHFQGDKALKRLPWQSPAGLQQAWCLDRNHLPYWLLKVPDQRVPVDLQERVLSLKKQVVAGLGWSYKKMQQDFQEARSNLFQMLNFCREAEQNINVIAGWIPRLPAFEYQKGLAERVAEGQAILNKLADQTRQALAKMLGIPVVDGYVIDENNVATDTISFPLFPIVPKSDIADIFALKDHIIEWSKRTLAWTQTLLDDWEKRVGLHDQ